jgi:hypothetical protein
VVDPRPGDVWGVDLTQTTPATGRGLLRCAREIAISELPLASLAQKKAAPAGRTHEAARYLTTNQGSQTLEQDPAGRNSTADCQVIAPSPNVCVSIIQMLQRLTNKTPSKSINARMMIGRTSA